MRFFAQIFAREGIPFDTAVSAAGRGNVWARLKGSGDAPALLLLSHMDVVPADTAYWHAPPFAAEVRSDTVYARGALDTKTLGIVELEAFLALHRLKVPLDRDVIFMATADEEAGGFYGAGWVVKHHPEAFRGAGMLLNEGGMGTVSDGREQFGIEVTQKVPLWLKLTSTGVPRPRLDPAGGLRREPAGGGPVRDPDLPLPAPGRAQPWTPTSRPSRPAWARGGRRPTATSRRR